MLLIFTCCLLFSQYELRNVSYEEAVRTTDAFDPQTLLTVAK